MSAAEILTRIATLAELRSKSYIEFNIKNTNDSWVSFEFSTKELERLLDEAIRMDIPYASAVSTIILMTSNELRGQELSSLYYARKNMINEQEAIEIAKEFKIPDFNLNWME